MRLDLSSRLLIAVVAAIPVAALPLSAGSIALPLTELLLPLAGGAVVIGYWRGRGSAPSSILQPREAWPVALFLVAALLSFVVTEYPRQSFRELRLLIVEPVAFYLLLRIAALDKTWALRAVIALVAVTTALAVVALALAAVGRGMVEAEGVQRLLGLHPSANHFALLLGRAIPFSLALALEGGARRLGYGVLTVVMMSALVGTFSGGGWMGTAASLLVIVWLTRGPRPVLAMVAIGAVVCGAVLTVLRVERIASRMDPTRGTGFIRVRLWEASLAMIRDHPILGIGLDNFLYKYQQEYLPLDAAVEPNLSHPHNWALNFWLSLGVLGLTAVIWLLLQFVGGIRSALASSNDPMTRALAVGAVGSMVSFLVHGAVDNSYFLPDMALMFWFTLALPRILMSRQSRIP